MNDGDSDRVGLAQQEANGRGRTRALIDVRGWEWVGGPLPFEGEAWPGARPEEGEPGEEELRTALGSQLWVLPARTLYFVSDPQADGGALLRSLVASGGVEKTGPDDSDLELTPEGRDAVFLIGGNVFGRGPSSLRVLRLLRELRDRDAHVEILAGQHDLRTLLGLRHLGSSDPRTAHLFVRMARWALPLFREVWDRDLRHARDDRPEGGEIDEATAASEMFPNESWPSAFPRAVPDLAAATVEREIARIQEKVAEFRVAAAQEAMTLPMVLAAARRCRAMIFEDEEFSWYVRGLRPSYRAGSILFVHAGVDDDLARMYASGGDAAIRRNFDDLWQLDPLGLYHGPLGNAVRTRYRNFDAALSEQGVRHLHDTGVYAIAHGHDSVLDGPKLQLRAGLLHLRCAAVLDANTRAREGLREPGAAVTVFRGGQVLGVNSQRLRVRVFSPGDYCKVLTLIDGGPLRSV